MFLEDILLAMNRICEYTDGLIFVQFKQDYKAVDAVIRNFEIIGEASKNIDKFIKLKYQDVPWEEMYYLRNRISHEYFGIDYEIIWDVIRTYLPENRKVIEHILKNEF